MYAVGRHSSMRSCGQRAAIVVMEALEVGSRSALVTNESARRVGSCLRIAAKTISNR